MERLDNPAGRLHALLTAFSEASATGSIQGAWERVLGTDGKQQTLTELAQVAALVVDIDHAVARSGDHGIQTLCDSFRSQWMDGIFAPQHNFIQTAAEAARVDHAALAALGSVSSFLSVTASEGPVPDAEAIADLKEKVRAAADAVAESDLPPEIARLLLDHLHAILWALDHVRFGGPDGVRAATERSLGLSR